MTLRSLPRQVLDNSTFSSAASYRLRQDAAVDPDTCGEAVLWSTIGASAPLSTLAGVLAGFLVLAATTAIFAPWDRYRWRTVVLFAAGVPALITSSFLCAFISGTRIPKTGAAVLLPLTSDDHQRRCDQLWSEWLLAVGLLATGAAVLICGLAWLLIGYTEKASGQRFRSQIVDAWQDDMRRNTGRAERTKEHLNYLRKDRVALVRAAGWISAAGIMTAAVILVTVSIQYIKATVLADHKLSAMGAECLTFLIWGAGIHTIIRTAYVVWARTRGAVTVNENACDAVYEILMPNDVLSRQPTSPSFWTQMTRWVDQHQSFREIVTLEVSVLVALMITQGTLHQAACDKEASECLNLTLRSLFEQLGKVTFIGFLFLLLYGSLRFLRWCVEHRLEPRADRDEAVLTDPEMVLRADYRHGRPAVVTGHVVASAFFSIALAGVFFQWDFQIGKAQSGVALALLVAGLHPILILRGLAEAVASGGDVPKVPRWKEETRILGLLFP
jgi:hypothetical protein